MTAGVTTPNLAQTAVSDGVVVNRGGNTMVQPTSSLAQQLNGDLAIGPDRAAAQLAAAQSQAARDAAFVNAEVYANTTAGLAATSAGEQFQVVSAEEIIRYRHDAGPAATEVARYPKAQRVTDLETAAVLIEQQLGRPLSNGYASGSVGTDAPSSGTLNAGTFAAADIQLVVSTLVGVRFRLMVAGTYEIHAFRRISEVAWQVDAVWPGAAGSTGLVTLEAGGGVIPEGYVLQPGDFVGIKVGTARIGYASGPGWITVNGDTGLGSTVTRTLNTNGYEISFAWDYGGVARSVDRRLTDVEDGMGAADRAMAALAASVLLAPPGTPLPDGYADTGVTLLGLRVIAGEDGVMLSGIFDGAPGFAIFPSSSPMFQDDAGTVVADQADDPVRIIGDVAPTPSVISAPGDASRPVLYETSTGRFLRFDGADDRFLFPSGDINRAAVTFVCSVAYRGGGVFPQVIGDQSTSNGLFCGFENDGRPRFGMSGELPAVLRAPAAVPLSTRVTLSYVYDGETARIFQNGALVASAAASGSFNAGTQPLICYSGAAGNPVTSPIDLYGAVLIGRGLSDSDRATVEAMVSSGAGAGAGAGALQAVIDAATQKMMFDFGAYFGLLSEVGTTAYALGDSTVAAYGGGTAIMDLIDSTRTKVSLAVPGHTIAQQLTVWNGTSIVQEDVAWVIVQIGLNDLNPGETAATALGRLQSLVNAIRARIGSRRLLISQMIPCRQRLINLHGAENGPVAYHKWLDMNAAIAGAGANAITGVDGRITAHVPLMNDGSGNLRAEYDTGDGIHPNTAGRQVNATAWEAALHAAGVVV